MKKYLVLTLAAALVMVLVPVAMIRPEKNAAPTAAPASEAPQDAAASADNETEAIAVFIESSGQTREMPMRDYILSVLAAEMPAAYAPEALKAQAAACVTFARYMRLHPRAEAAAAGAVISTDPAKYQGYLSDEEMRARWGDAYEENRAKLEQAVDAVLPYQIEYGGEPIMAAFHAVSAGQTESAETVWGKKIPYLVSVESEGDRLSPGYESSETFSAEALREKLALPADCGDPAGWLGESSYSPAGTLLSLHFAGKTFTGAALRQQLNLRSAAVTVQKTGDSFVFTVRGYGHGVGMSQYGADYCARQGMTWQEIVQHYYPGTQLADARS